MAAVANAAQRAMVPSRLVGGQHRAKLQTQHGSVVRGNRHRRHPSDRFDVALERRERVAAKRQARGGDLQALMQLGRRRKRGAPLLLHAIARQIIARDIKSVQRAGDARTVERSARAFAAHEHLLQRCAPDEHQLPRVGRTELAAKVAIGGGKTRRQRIQRRRIVVPHRKSPR
jgi:hypothetical protein